MAAVHVPGSAELPRELKERIRKLGEDWKIDPVTHVPEWKPIPLVPDVRTRSYYDPGQAGPLTCQPPSPKSSPWDERWVPETDDEQALEERLREERDRADQWAGERASLPIVESREEILSTIRGHRVTLVAAETGSGKSTQVPQYILDDAIDREEGVACHVVCTQPRRLAAVSLAQRVAWERGEGFRSKTVGHVVRWDEQPPRPWGSIVFCTVGSLLPRIRKLGASHIVVDEAHTRDVHTDLLLTVLLEVLRNSPHLRVLIMSATCNIAKLHKHFGDEFDCAVVEAQGRPFQVREYFLEDIVTELSWKPSPARKGEEARSQDASELPRGAWDGDDCNRSFCAVEQYPQRTVEVVQSLEEHVLQLHLVAAVLHWVAGMKDRGSVLVFLPGWQEINACDALLKRDPDLYRIYEVIRLHSTVPPNEQQRAFWPARRGFSRKVILSTDIAETSVTIPDVICVVDTGVARVKINTSLEVRWASQANLIQRRGRAGRVRDGLCVHLFTRQRFSRLDLEPTPEMKRVPIEEVVLSVCDLALDTASANDYERDGASAGVAKFLAQAPDPPEEWAVGRAFKALQHVGALDDCGWITHLGSLLARLPLAPVEGASLWLGGLLGAPQAASRVIASLAGNREPWARRGKTSEDPPAALARFARDANGEAVWSDAFAVANALQSYDEECGSSMKYQDRFCAQNELHPAVMQQMWSARKQLLSTLLDMGCWPSSSNDGEGGTGSTGPAVDDTLTGCWPLMQTVLAFASGWSLGEFDGGRKVRAGFNKPARLAKNSVFCSGVFHDCAPPSQLLAYADLSSGSGGRVLRGATMVKPHQLVLFGGREGPEWHTGSAIIDNWLCIPMEFDTAVALGLLRAVTRRVLQCAAEFAMPSEPGAAAAPICQEEWVREWRECVMEVAMAPLPEALPYSIMPYFEPPRPAYYAPLVQQPAPWGATSAPSTSDLQVSRTDAPSAWRSAGEAESGQRPLSAWDVGQPAAAPQQLQGPGSVQHARAGDAHWAQVAPIATQQLQAPLSAQHGQSAELPIGWSEHTDEFGRVFFHDCNAASRWDRPANAGRDGSAGDWRWISCMDGSCLYVRDRAGTSGDAPPVHHVVRPDVGDGHLLPLGWCSCWNAERKRHYYWSKQNQSAVTWDFPSRPP